MSLFKNIFSSKLSIITLVILPTFIVLLILAWIYMLFFNIPSTISQDPQNNSLVATSNSSDQIIAQTSQNSVSQKKPTNVSFNDLEKLNSSKTLQNITTLPISLLASPPELVFDELNTLLAKIESLDINDDAALDNQIIQN